MTLAIYVAARVWHLTASCLWFDEIFSVHAARQSWPELFRFTAADIIHPPLFYALLKIWIALGGESLLWLRLLPFLFAIATIVPFYLLARELKVNSVAINISLLLMAVSGFLIKYAQEVRMYSMLLFLSVTSVWLFARFLNATHASRTVAWLALAICNLLLVYTHYYGWLLVAGQGVVLLLWHRKKLASFIIAATALVVAYSPWVYAVARYREPGKGLAQNIGWINKPNLSDISDYFVLLSKPFLFSQSTLDLSRAFFTGTLVLLVLIVSIVLLFLRRRRERKLEAAEKMLLMLLIVPLIVAVSLSWLLPYSIWGTRHLIVSAVPFFMLAGLGLEGLRPFWAKLAVLIVLGCVMTLAGALYLIQPAPKLSWCAWDGLIKQIPATAENSTALVYTFEDLVAYHLWFASTSQATPYLRVKVLKGLAGVPEDPAFFLPRRFMSIETVAPGKIDHDHIWIAFRARGWDENSPPLSYVKSLGYEPQKVLSATAEGEQAFLVELNRPGN